MISSFVKRKKNLKGYLYQLLKEIIFIDSKFEKSKMEWIKWSQSSICRKNKYCVTYGVRHKKTQEIDIMTYVDYVDIHGSAYVAGLRKGICVARGLNREDVFRQSIYSNKSSLNSWDDISLISSPQMLRNQTKSWATNSGSSDNITLKSSNEGEDNSIEESLNFDDSYIDITYADSDSDSGACMNDSVFEINQSKNKIDENREKEEIKMNIKLNVLKNKSVLADSKSINSIGSCEIDVLKTEEEQQISQCDINSDIQDRLNCDLTIKNIETNSSDTDIGMNTSDSDVVLDEDTLSKISVSEQKENICNEDKYDNF
ncbi:hypothetical protein KUTeg_002510 [Tegillarca granosa]|uniref:Uncharacterized protein n=1 Tax=Tegillarca granosa TaxID=220873 RepID=A0ABQ9FZ05_TEGGR|nr:hypothetical protein KUTeg_002510 [Tegillarca granosa]